MEPEITEFVRSFRTLAQAAKQVIADEDDELSEVGAHLQRFLGVALTDVEPVMETFLRHQVVDLDLALEALLTEHGGERRGISGQHRDHMELDDFLHRRWFRLGPVAYERRPSGPDTDRRVVGLGFAEVRIEGVPLVCLQRAANPQYGRDRYTLELLCPDRDVTDRFLARTHELMAERSVLRGQVISFAPNPFDYHAAGAELTFLRRPEVGAEAVVLPEGVRERVIRHVVGIGAHRDALRQAGQHLKRGVLLYGPPGTGKTHLLRHVLSETPGTTAVLLSGRTLDLLNPATALARAAQPAIVVLEDCDLVAEHRGGETNAALFETLEAMDGLAPDADIAFILTTNRVDLLERALVERPGRVDLAVEIAKPDREARERLFRLYAAEMLAAGQLSDAAVHTAAERTEGVTASFTKELIRRVVINAAQQQRAPRDGDVSDALDEMLSDAESLTRTLLGGEGPAFATAADWEKGASPGIAPGAYWSDR